MRRRGPTWALLLALVAGCGEVEDDRPQLVVSAAASLGEVVTDLAEAYRAVDPGVTIATNFAASGTLVQQIRQGAGVDVFLSAADREMGILVGEGLVAEGSVVAVAGNELVLVVPPGSEAITSFAQLAEEGVGRVALGAPASVPAGEYARQALTSLGLWEAVEPKAVFASNVRQALAYVEAGEVDAALVYRTDAVTASRARIVAAAPPTSHSPIRYSGAVIAASRHQEAARGFLDFVARDGRAVFAAHGFLPPPGAGEE